MSSYWSVYRRIRKNVDETMRACEEESMHSSHPKVPRVMMNEVDTEPHSKDKECQPSLFKTSSTNSGSETDFVLSCSSDVEEENDYFDALSDVSDGNVDSDTDSDLEECDTITDEKKAENLGFELGLWASSFGISLVALSALLAVLRVYYPLLPKDPRTLLKTPRNSTVRQVDGGTYFHFGVMKTLTLSKKLLEYSVPISKNVCYSCQN